MKNRKDVNKSLADSGIASDLSPSISSYTVDNEEDFIKKFFDLTDPTIDQIKNTRLFEFPFFFIGNEPNKKENKKLLTQLKKFARRKDSNDYTSILHYINQSPQSPWNVTLFANLGIEFFRVGQFSNSIDYFERAWKSLSLIQEEIVYEIANRVVVELSRMYARLGRIEDLQRLLLEINTRNINGSSAELLSGAKEGLLLMENEPDKAFKCGIFALGTILKKQGLIEKYNDTIKNTGSSVKGFSLTQIRDFSKEFGLNYQMAKREKGATVIVPCVMHLNLQHYCALTEQSGREYKLQDPTFGIDYTQWISRNTLESESSGYFLVPEGNLPKGWHKIGDTEGQVIWGKGNTNDSDRDRNSQYDDKANSEECQKGMASYNIHLLKVNLLIQDIPIGYTPPRGLAVYTKLSYNHREAGQAATMYHSNLGTRWTFNWLGFIEDFGALTDADTVTLFDEEGGVLKFTGYDKTSKQFNIERYAQARLLKNSTDKYTLTLPDGSQKIFSLPDGTQGAKRRVYLTEIIDNTGVNKITLSYTRPGGIRLVSVRDANGLSTTFSYDNPYRPFQVTKITDPYGRNAQLKYDTLNRLNKIIDVIGLESSFSYDGTSDFINKLTTPYGSTSFFFEETSTPDPSNPALKRLTRRLTATDPNGDKEVVQYGHLSPTEYPSSEAEVPSKGSYINNYLYYRNVFHWDKKTMKERPFRDFRDARVYHFVHGEQNVTGGFIESVKFPLENRIWYNYPGQTSPYDIGTIKRPTRIARVIEGGEQTYEMQYNSLGSATQIIDPQGRTTRLSYDPTNELNLTAIHQLEAGRYTLLTAFEYDTVFKYLPKFIKEANGSVVTEYEYNNFGLIKKITLPNSRIIEYTYDNNGYLSDVDWGYNGVKTRFTYKTRNGVKMNLIDFMTDPDGNQIGFEYDNLDRITKIKYKDGSFDGFTYDKLDLKSFTDRRGLVPYDTHFEYDALRQLKKVIGTIVGKGDNSRPVNLFEWCKCGSVSAIIDPNGNRTEFAYDIQGRLTKKTYADGLAEDYGYEPKSGRLSYKKDAKDQHTRFQYDLDNNLNKVSYTDGNGQPLSPTTPSVFYEYDAFFNRLKKITDSLGTMQYTYVDYNRYGGGNIASILSSVQDCLTSFDYDKMGQLAKRTINRTPGNSLVMEHRWSYDTLNRLSEEQNNLGTFRYNYDGSSDRLIEITYPKNITTQYTWDKQFVFPMLKSITTQFNNQFITQFGYDYDRASLNMTKMTQAIDTGTGLMRKESYIDYDVLKRLYNVTQNDLTNGGTAAIHDYRYDQSDNRLMAAETQSNVKKYYRVNNLNQANYDTAAATNVARYDRNGNLIEDERHIYTWDAANRLVKINYKNGTGATMFFYDGLRRIVKVKETMGETTFLYDGIERCAEFTNNNLDKIHTAQGHQSKLNGNTAYRLTDHLGSTRMMVDANNPSVRTYQEYDPFGVAKYANASNEGLQKGYAGYLYHAKSGLNLTLFRAYDASNARWLSRDPIGGTNLYQYVENDPLNLIDPLGLFSWQDIEVPQWLVDSSAGFGSGLTLGITDRINKLTGADKFYSKCSTSYQVGDFLGQGLRDALITGLVFKGLAKIARFAAPRLPLHPNVLRQRDIAHRSMTFIKGDIAKKGAIYIRDWRTIGFEAMNNGQKIAIAFNPWKRLLIHAGPTGGGQTTLQTISFFASKYIL